MFTAASSSGRPTGIWLEISAGTTAPPAAAAAAGPSLRCIVIVIRPTFTTQRDAALSCAARNNTKQYGDGESTADASLLCEPDVIILVRRRRHSVRSRFTAGCVRSADIVTHSRLLRARVEKIVRTIRRRNRREDNRDGAGEVRRVIVSRKRDRACELLILAVGGCVRARARACE